ncbi:epoxide hydrolase [Hyaloraphidium curvatum]|nr:epoxide hydrolase [Hyaloraphidium curvatum]
MENLPPLPLPSGVRSRFVPGCNGLTVHVLEAGFETAGRPCALLLHGFPELAFSWRLVMPGLAALGFHVLAPDLRGYGRTTGWDNRFDGDVASFRMSNLVIDAISLLFAFGHRRAYVVGHDFGSFLAGHIALMRPDVCQALVLMSAPFTGGPSLPFDYANAPKKQQGERGPSIHEQLAALPQPRIHYQMYYSERRAESDMLNAPSGFHAFMRAYFHHKSGDWEGNRPHPLKARSAEAMAVLPSYYIMNLGATMPESVIYPTDAEVAEKSSRWLPDSDLAVYVQEYQRAGFQGGLNWYRSRTSTLNDDVALFAGIRLSVPFIFVGGDRDWGVWQTPGAIEAMEKLPGFRGRKMLPGAGHWVTMEAADVVTNILRDFFESLKVDARL